MSTLPEEICARQGEWEICTEMSNDTYNDTHAESGHKRGKSPKDEHVLKFSPYRSYSHDCDSLSLVRGGIGSVKYHFEKYFINENNSY